MNTKSIDSRTAYAEVLRTAEAIRSDAHEVIATMSPGDVVRQGDLYITCLDSEPRGGVPAGTRQLAPERPKALDISSRATVTCFASWTKVLSRPCAESCLGPTSISSLVP